MTTDTAEKGVEDPIASAMTGRPSELVDGGMHLPGTVSLGDFT